MVLLDIEIPKTCAECFMSCRLPTNEILCRKDMDRHEPLDSGCPIKRIESEWNPPLTRQERLLKRVTMLIEEYCKEECMNS